MANKTTIVKEILSEWTLNKESVCAVTTIKLCYDHKSRESHTTDKNHNSITNATTVKLVTDPHHI